MGTIIINLFYLLNLFPVPKVTMQFLQQSFHIFSICGCWVPESIKNSKYKLIAYNLYVFTILGVVLAFLYLRTIVIIRLPEKNVSNFAASTIAYFESFCTVFKAITIYRKRIDLLKIRSIFLKCSNKNSSRTEVGIQNDVNNTCK